MMPAGRIRRLRIRIPLLLLTFLSLSCGIGGSDFAGGGTGGTGISTGSISGFGSVVMNGVHFRTDNNTKKMLNGNEDKSGRMDNVVFAVGMIVTVRHGVGDNDAQKIEYRNNLEGPISSMSSGDNTFEVLGQTVVVDNGAAFALHSPNDVVEVSGFVDSAGRIRATYIERKMQPPRPAKEYEVKGFVSGLPTIDNTFLLGLLPDGSVPVVTVLYAPPISGFPGGLENRMYVQVTTIDTMPSGGRITGTRVEILPPRTDFPDKSIVDLEGFVTAAPSGSGNVLSFAVEGKAVRTDDATVFASGKTAADIQRDVRLQVRGAETGGVLSAVNIIFR